MPTRWESLHDHFDAVVRSASTAAFACLATDDALIRFADLPALCAYLLERADDLDRRDRALAALIRGAHRAETRTLATALLWLALWPGLTAIYGRRCRRGDRPEEVVAAVGYAFTALVADADLARVHRVAATLVRSTERDALRALRPSDVEVPLAEDDRVGAPVTSLEQELRAAREWLLRLVGGDADLVLAVAALDESQAEAAARLGMTYEGARKRYQRAIGRLRVAAAAEAA